MEAPGARGRQIVSALALEPFHAVLARMVRAGTIISVSDVQNRNGGGFYGPYGGGGFYGPFGPDRYCGIEHRPVFKIVNHKHKLVRVKKVRACIVPPSQATTLTVTYNAQ